MDGPFTPDGDFKTKILQTDQVVVKEKQHILKDFLCASVVQTGDWDWQISFLLGNKSVLTDCNYIKFLHPLNGKGKTVY